MNSRHTAECAGEEERTVDHKSFVKNADFFVVVESGYRKNEGGIKGFFFFLLHFAFAFFSVSCFWCLEMK